MMAAKIQMGNSGRIVVPARLRKALGIQVGDEIVIRVENGEMRLIPLRQAIALAQDTVRQYVPEGVSLVDELIQQRREEASGEPLRLSAAASPRHLGRKTGREEQPGWSMIVEELMGEAGPPPALNYWKNSLTAGSMNHAILNAPWSPRNAMPVWKA